MPLLRQTYLKGNGVERTLEWSLCSDTDDVSKLINKPSSSSSAPTVVGLAIHVNKKGVMELGAAALGRRVIIFKADVKGNESLKGLLGGSSGRVAGFGVVRQAMHIKQALAHDVCGYNLPPEGEASPGSAARRFLDPSADTFQIDRLWNFPFEDMKDGKKRMEYLCLRAWLSQRLASHSKWYNIIEISKAAEMSRLSNPEFERLFGMVKELDMIDAANSRVLQNDFNDIQHTKDKQVILHNARYKTRVRMSKTTRIVLVDTNGREHGGKTKGVQGKRTFIGQTTVKSSTEIKKVRVEGCEELTNAEKARDTFLLRLLRGESILSDALYPFIGYLWFPSIRRINLKRICNARTRSGQGDRLLNQSQTNVVEAMINPHRPIIVAHGPPGTGKTTTISVAMREVYAARRTAWVVAQSNVGVKNIAESLCKHGVGFKLLVSKEFYEEWHEHIYAEVESHLILVHLLPKESRDVEVTFHGTRVVLCTISTLSNPKLEAIGLFRLLPMKMLVVDEASQIGVFEYLHIFGRLKELGKVCFFGDPKQLPPYGRDAAPSLQSIFDLSHLKSSAYFLDTQYRMPTRLGDFISHAVYQSKLKSVHDISGWDSIRFVDVWNGTEEKVGKSWKNTREVQTIVHLVRHYYRRKEYCIITPYDAQRSVIQETLKAEKLPWENVFNVDSFQGNEAQYVLVSVVRTTGPGFLKSQNRVNVMLTRCKAGMVIVSKREFTRYESVRKTLLGKLVLHWEEKVGRSNSWCKWVDVAGKKAALPGVQK